MNQLRLTQSLEYLRSDFQLLNQRLTTNNSLKINHRTSFINTVFDIESGDLLMFTPRL